MNKYSYPANVDRNKLKVEALHRRSALENNGCQTYILGLKNSIPSILCCCCGLGSVNPNDIKEKYCGFCHTFHSEWEI